MGRGNGKNRRGGRKPTGQTTTSGSISKDLLRKVSRIAAHMGISKSKVLDRYGAPGIERQFQRVLREEHQELGVSQAG